MSPQEARPSSEALAATPGGTVVAVVAALISCFILFCYFNDRKGGVDEIGLYNPTYMAVHYGKMTYPVHGYFDTMVVHPPVHYSLIALFMRAGMGLYYAQATPTVLALLVCVFLIVRSPLLPLHKIGFLLAVYAPISAFGKLGAEWFGMRPENHLNAAWLAGLIALESARLENWNLKKLFGGAFLTTYASGLHYYATPAFLGVVVYAGWAVRQLGWRVARKPLLALAGGGLLFGIPHLLFFVIPDWNDIVTLVRSAGGYGDVRRALAVHLEHYRFWTQTRLGGPWLWPVLALGVPLTLLSGPVLTLFRQTRGIALASLPLQLVLLLLISRKHGCYFVHEITIYAAAIFTALLTLAQFCTTRLRLLSLRSNLPLAVAVAIAAALVYAHLGAGTIKISLEPRLHESEIARAAGREMLGPDSRVGGRIGIWYASGAAHWYGISPDLLWNPIKFDLNEYFSRFDAFAEHQHGSFVTRNDQKATLSSWYADGSLRLAGFYFAEADPELSYLLLGARPREPLIGFGLKNNQLYRFVEDANGDHEMASYACTLTSDIDSFRARASFSGTIYLPKPDANLAVWPPPGTVLADRVVLTALRPRPELAPAPAVPVGCSEFYHVRGALLLADGRDLVEKLRREDRPMRFYRKMEDLPKRGPAASSLPGPGAPSYRAETLPKPVTPKAQ